MKTSYSLLALALLSCSPSRPGAPELEVTHAWARPTIPGKPTSAAYLTISNRGGADDALLSVTSSTGAAQVHSTSMHGGIMRMRQMDRLAIPAGETVKLEPGGTHVMLTGLTQPLEPGSRIDLVMRFEKSGQRRVAAEVRATGDQM